MNIGDKFPDLLGLDSEGKEVKLSDYPGKKFIIYFYPKDNTAGCSAEACSLQSGEKILSDMGYQIIGVSKDSVASHEKFATKYSLKFPLVADTDLKLCNLAGVWQKKKMAGREYFGIVRTTFVTDETGVVTDKIEKVKTKEAAEQLFSLLDGRDRINP
ncbi:MAG: peroxiredoxin [Clostridium sp.]|nr:peroxiredoxin [Prevotella sp.]MCM1428234.1 peroxiredoxin [Clostridium sp.]MCM1474718.1 peroxiredoxin [Muribaculaceae bacterium]